VRNLPLPFIEVISLGASGSGIPPQGASGSSIPVDESDLQYVAFKVDRLHLAQTKCPEMPGGSLKKKPGRANVVLGAYGNWGTWHYPDQGAYKAQV
jgi:hypothetical protein